VAAAQSWFSRVLNHAFNPRKQQQSLRPCKVHLLLSSLEVSSHPACPKKSNRLASQIRARRVVINGMTDDPEPPWGGFKYTGVGREYGRYGIGVFLETRAMLAAR
jgi:hypothetical protein